MQLKYLQLIVNYAPKTLKKETSLRSLGIFLSSILMLHNIARTVVFKQLLFAYSLGSAETDGHLRCGDLSWTFFLERSIFKYSHVF